MSVLVTGAAGFIGSHVVRKLVKDGVDVVATDIVERPARIAEVLGSGRVRYLGGALDEVLAEAIHGVAEVWHFAANADIPLGARDTSIDLRDSVMLTRRVLEAMRAHGIPRIAFPSTSGVYGTGLGPIARESDGPLLPCSLYAAGKLACEGLISAYAHTFGIRGTIFRLGNVVGGAMGRGIVRDFVAKLRGRPDVLPVLGDGRQRKSYVLVDDVVAGMSWVAARQPADRRVDVVNLAAGDSLDVGGVAAQVAKAMGIPAPRIVATSGDASWPGDQPVIELGIDKALATGWRPTTSVSEAVRIAADRILAEG